MAGGVLIGAAVWAVMWLLLAVGAAPLVALGVLFVALTLAGTPIVFMLSIVGIMALFAPTFLGLELLPQPRRLRAVLDHPVHDGAHPAAASCW